MKTEAPTMAQVEQRSASQLLEVLIRAGVILAMVMLCYRVFSPFLTLMTWALILAVTLYPLHRAAKSRMGGRSGLAATALVIVSILLLVVPTAILMSSLGDSIQDLVHDVQNNAVSIPAPPDAVAGWPIIGERLHAIWAQAHSDLPSLVHTLQPKIGDLAKGALAFVASIGGGLLQFLAALIIAGIVMAFGEGGSRSVVAILDRVAGDGRGEALATLATATIRAVAQGVIGVAFIQAIVVGLCLLIAHVPWAGVLTLVVLVIGIAQVPALIVTLPAIAWIWLRADYGTGQAVLYSLLIFVAGMADNVLKPLMLGRGVAVPMPVILLGALGGMATAGILGMFVGATLLGLGYELFTGWVASRRAAAASPRPGETATVNANEASIYPDAEGKLSADSLKT